MHGFSTVDGLGEISERLAEMIKYVANEPSVGLFFIQQHSQNAVPNVIKIKNNVTEKSHQTNLQTEDLEDSVNMARSMKECGFPIVNDMIGEIKNSLVTMTTKKPKGGFIHRSASNSQMDRATFGDNSDVYAQEISSDRRGNYFLSVFNFSKQKASSLKTEKPQLCPNLPFSVTNAGITPSQDTEVKDPRLSHLVDDDKSQLQQSDISDVAKNLLLVSETYDVFKANREAKLEEWLEGTSTNDEKMI